MGVDSEIQSLSRERHQLWCAGAKESTRIARITSMLYDLYEQKRIERAKRPHGNPAGSIRRSSVTRAYERLMSR